MRKLIILLASVMALALAAACATPTATPTPSVKWGISAHPIILTPDTQDWTMESPFILQACYRNSGVNEDGQPVKYFIAGDIIKGSYAEVAGFADDAVLTAKHCYNMAVEFVEHKRFTLDYSNTPYHNPVQPLYARGTRCSFSGGTVRCDTNDYLSGKQTVGGPAFRLIDPKAFEYHRR